MATEDPLQKYNSLLASSDFLWVVCSSSPSESLPVPNANLHQDFRGHWCPFCMGYLKTFQSLVPSITAAGGQTLIVTAESAEHLPASRTTTGYQGEAIVDPEHVLAKYFKEKGLLDVAITERKGYEHGLAQPAVLVIQKDGTVLEKWAIVPSAVCHAIQPVVLGEKHVG